MRSLASILMIVFLFTACQSVSDEESLETEAPVVQVELSEEDGPVLEALPELPPLKDSSHKAPLKGNLKNSTNSEEELFPELVLQRNEAIIRGEKLVEPGLLFESPLEESPLEEELILEPPGETQVPIQEDLVLIDGLPSEMDLIPVNPLQEEDLPPHIESEYLPPAEDETLPVILDKDEIFEVYEAVDPEKAYTPLEEELLDDSVYVIKLDHLNRLVIALDGSGWIFLSVLSPELPSLSLQDKKYNPETKKTEFVFRLDGTAQKHTLVMMKQDLSGGESGQYILNVEETDMQPLSLAAEDIEEKGLLSVESPEIAVVEASMDDSVPDVIAEITDEAVLKPESLRVDPESLRAEALLVLAGNYENPGPGQSLERARDCYLLLLEKFPVSMERFKAEERLRYLDRHYFKVQ